MYDSASSTKILHAADEYVCRQILKIPEDEFMTDYSSFIDEEIKKKTGPLKQLCDNAPQTIGLCIGQTVKPNTSPLSASFFPYQKL